MNDIKLISNKLEYQSQTNMKEGKPYKCTQCTKAFANSSYLSQHTRIHLGIKPYLCEICQRKFTQLSHLQQHIRTHTGDKPYKCRHTGCIKQFSQLSNLQSHSRCHQTDRPFKCNSCYKCFNDETALLQHIPKHKESKHLKTHICQYCGKSYTQETYLQKHLQKHIERNDKRMTTTAIAFRNSNTTTNVEQPFWNSKESIAIISDPIQQSQQQQQQHHHQSHQTTHYEFVINSQQNQSRTTTHEIKDISSPQMNHHIPITSSSSSDELLLNTTNSNAKLNNNSAFTPINIINPLSSLQHQQISQRPIYYDAIALQNRSVSQGTMNCFPNQLISLHQIRNFQPSDHLISISSSTAQQIKEKGQ
ncbi:hypothetical protein PVAND_011439 [Polypedilum vanderplanki]|uniref:C2H2-type domain-containing protein n=1 Tax=Polypedilum vanderplanki TaxID=319348 RepID=A0A9J6CK33_POLVA|nr:hypothetical protein PVAND_011439 [Polypedilum vanderplanki]